MSTLKWNALQETEKKSQADFSLTNSTCILWKNWFNSYSVIWGWENLGWIPEVDALLGAHVYWEAKVVCGWRGVLNEVV